VPRVILGLSPDDPALADFRQVKDRQLRRAFRPAHELAHEVDRSGEDPEPLDPQAPHGKFMIEGELVLRAALAQHPGAWWTPWRLRSVVLTPARLASMDAELATLGPEVPVFVLEPEAISGLVGFDLHRGVMAVGVRRGPDDPFHDWRRIVASATPKRPLIVLEDVFNHDNIGGVFRNAAAFGAGGVLLSRGCADPLYRKALRVSVGHALNVPWGYVDALASPTEGSGSGPGALAALRDAGLRAAAMTPGPDAVELVAWLRDGAAGAGAGKGRDAPVALVFGSEGPGLSSAVLGACAARVRVAMSEGVDSLNVAVSCAVALALLRSVRD
jgi:tRNA G18 (ribose-2'-O)-methylase SpoU